VVDAHEDKTEIRALCRNVIVAKAAFTAAVEQRAGKRVKLTRGAQCMRIAATSDRRGYGVLSLSRLTIHSPVMPFADARATSAPAVNWSESRTPALTFSTIAPAM
jgi:hypothetical protein